MPCVSSPGCVHLLPRLLTPLAFALWRLPHSVCLCPSRRASQLVVTVTGYQLYNDANEFYFSHECVPPRAANTANTAARFPFSLLISSLSSLLSCRRCDGTGKLTCNKCRGYGYLKKGSDDK